MKEQLAGEATLQAQPYVPARQRDLHLLKS
jgi:hypothetical protein